MSDGEYTQEQLEKAAMHQAATEAVKAGGRRGQDTQQKNDNLVNPERVRKRLKKSLRAAEEKYYQKENGEIFTRLEPDEDAALINEQGFKKLWSYVESALSQNVAGAYWSGEQIYKNGYAYMASIIEQVFRKHDDWGIEDSSDADEIVSIISLNLASVMSKARGARSMKHIETTRHEDVRRIEKTGEENNKSWLNKLGV